MGDEFTLLKAEVKHIREKVDHIDTRLEAMDLGSRMAVIEDRQKTLFNLVHGIAGLFGTIIAGIIVWLVTRGG